MPVDMGPQFSQLLAYYGNKVIAMGPLGYDDAGNPDYVEELNAWVYQEQSLTADAAAAPLDPVGTPILQAPGTCWMHPLTRITSANQAFHGGRAFAVAVALFSNADIPDPPRDIGNKNGHVIWWGHPVYLLEDQRAV